MIAPSAPMMSLAPLRRRKNQKLRFLMADNTARRLQRRPHDLGAPSRYNRASDDGDCFRPGMPYRRSWVFVEHPTTIICAVCPSRIRYLPVFVVFHQTDLFGSLQRSQDIVWSELLTPRKRHGGHYLRGISGARQCRRRRPIAFEKGPRTDWWARAPVSLTEFHLARR